MKCQSKRVKDVFHVKAKVNQLIDIENIKKQIIRNYNYNNIHKIQCMYVRLIAI